MDPADGPRRKGPGQAGPPGPGLPSNAIGLSRATLEELKKMADSRGLPVEKLVAQLIAQYLKEGAQAGDV